MFILYFIISLMCVCVNSKVFDQRQTGELNIQVEVKDVNFFALMKGNKEEYVDYDYAYDYSQLTIKPQNRTTPKPFNRISIYTEPASAIQNSTVTLMLLQNSSTEAAITATDTVTNVSDADLTTIKQISKSTTQTISEMNITVPPISSPSVKNCRKGFVLNQKGDCQLRQNNTENALMKLVKLSQKLKLRRGP